MKNNSYLEKGFYSHPQIRGYMFLKQFMLIRKASKRCLLFRFENESALEFKAMELTLVQLDAEGNVIEKSKVKYKGLHVRPGALFCPESGVVVSEDCVDFKIKVTSLISGRYKYTPKNGDMVAHYDTRGYSDRKRAKLSDEGLEIESRNPLKGKFYGFMAFIAILLIFSALSLVISRSYVSEASPDEAYAQTENYSI